MFLYENADLFELGDAADRRRRALHPDDVVTYIIDRNVNYTNVCTARCRFCNFYTPPGKSDAYVLTKEALAEKFRETEALGGIQILLQGGLNPELGLAYYEDLFRWTKANFRLRLHALSPTEIVHIAHLEDMSIRDVLVRLRDAGMDSLPGGGAELLHDEIRNRISPFKNSTDEWLEVMRVAHQLGMKSTCTMVFGFQESAEHILVHLDRLRRVQDEAEGSGRFTAFIVWPFQADGTSLRLRDDTSPWRYLRIQALARLYLDNIENIQVSWPTLGPEIGEVALRFGANDFGSVMIEENVVSPGGRALHAHRGSDRAPHPAGGLRAVAPQHGVRQAERMKAILAFGRLVRLSHTVFGLPFALASTALAHVWATEHGQEGLTWWRLVLIVVAFTGARAAAMGFNRIVDRRIDAANPRTADRELPKGVIGVGAAWALTLASAGAFLGAAWGLGPLPLLLAPVCLLVIFGYSLFKRFSWSSHLVLGAALALAPGGAWIAVTGGFDGWPTPTLLMLAVATWVAGFDILYALADIDFDRESGLHSIPARFGIRGALVISGALHILTVGLLIALHVQAGLRPPPRDRRRPDQHHPRHRTRHRPPRRPVPLGQGLLRPQRVRQPCLLGLLLAGCVVALAAGPRSRGPGRSGGGRRGRRRGRSPRR